MVTQPLGYTGVKVRPFVTTDFQGVASFDEPPAAGVNVAYRPNKDLTFSLTNWIGPGLVLGPGKALHPPYEGGAYGSSIANVLSNWQGPNLSANRGGTLYFVDANIVWRPADDLTLSAEYLLATTPTSGGTFGWSGAMLLANYDLTDHWSLFGRASYLDDHDWLVTGTFQDIYEVSGGVSYRFTDKIELRAEYRHDSSNAAGNLDTVSIDFTAGF